MQESVMESTAKPRLREQVRARWWTPDECVWTTSAQL